jgi:hypothetical protein
MLAAVPTGGLDTLIQFAMATAMLKWLWPSMNPGTSVRPSRSTTTVCGPRCRSTSAADPTALIFPSLTATASAVGFASSMVSTGPPI